MAQFAFVVLHYLALDVTVQCVEKLLALKRGEHGVHVVIVENGSGNGSGEALRRRFDGERAVTVLESPENLGFARGNNLGYRWAREKLSPDYLVVMNNDVFIEDASFLDHADESARRELCAVLGPDIFCPASGRHQSPSHRLVPDEAGLARMQAYYDAANRHFLRFYLTQKLEKAHPGLKKRLDRRPGRIKLPSVPPPDRTREDRQVVLHGACYIFTREFIDARKEAFCPDTFLYMEEDILAWQCLRAGLRMRYDPSLQVLHMEDAATRLAARGEYRQMRLKFREKGRSIGVLRALMASAAEEARTLSAAPLPALPGLSCEVMGEGYGGSPVNCAIYRQGALTSARLPGREDREHFAAWYDRSGHVLLARRLPGGEDWQVTDTGLSGDIRDAHNAISLCADGRGLLHLAFSRHNGEICYARSDAPCSGRLMPEALPDLEAASVTYPEFHATPGGDMFLLCRLGRSGSGRVALMRYDCEKALWRLVTDALIDGGEACSPYWMACTDGAGRLHVAWTWRDASDAGANHDLCYLCLTDADGALLPRTPGNTEPIRAIPAGSGLINQGTLATDGAGRPFLSALWRENGILQHHILWQDEGSAWHCEDTGLRHTDFAVGGRGTQRFPFARPLLLVRGAGADAGKNTRLILVSRDDEVGGRAYAAAFTRRGDCLEHGRTLPLTDADLGAWEPCCDREAWRAGENSLRLLLQHACYIPDSRTALSVDVEMRCLIFDTDTLFAP